MDVQTEVRRAFVRSIQGLPPEHHRFGDAVVATVTGALMLFGPAVDFRTMAVHAVRAAAKLLGF